jgi:hypothetical protein
MKAAAAAGTPGKDEPKDHAPIPPKSQSAIVRPLQAAPAASGKATSKGTHSTTRAHQSIRQTTLLSG